MELIDKAFLVAEIERRQEEEVSYCENGSFASWADENHYFTLETIKSFIDTLEVKEVDLEKEIEEHVESMPMSEFTHESEVDAHWDWARKEFRHFFELGLKVQKGKYLGH